MLDPNPRLSATFIRGAVTQSGTAPSTWQLRRLATSTKVYLINMLLMFTSLVLIVASGYFDTDSVANISNSKQELWSNRN